MAVTLRLIGDDVIVSRLDRLRPAVRERLRGTIASAVERLQRQVLETKLRGQVLRAAAHGPLRQSIRADVRDEPTSVIGEVRVEEGPKTPGWALHEYAAAGATVRVRAYRRRSGQVHPYSYMVRKQRSFLRSSLGELRGT